MKNIYIYDTEANHGPIARILETIFCMRYMALTGEYPWGQIICWGSTKKGTHKKAVRKLAKGKEWYRKFEVMRVSLDD